MRLRAVVLIAGAALGLGAGSGCVVPQPRGEGLYKRVKEPQTGAIYHLYLPVDYVRNNGRHPNDPQMKRWPLVMTFHGMKPYDNAHSQEREWEKQADIYGYIVCAPELHSSDSFMEYPLTREHSYVLKDREDVMAIMDHVFVTTLADPKRVLSTSWSSGGYLAHYFPNRFPDRFSCIATRLSNFSAKLMLESTVPLYKNRVAVAIFAGDSDLPATKRESEEAVAWYMARNFRVVRGKMIDRMGHSRIPQTAAAFFAEQLGIKPLHPLEAEKTLALVQMTDYYPPQELIAKMSPPPQMGATLARAGTSKPLPRRAAKPQREIVPPKPKVTYVSTNAGRDYPFDHRPEYDPNPERRVVVAARKAKPSVPPTGAGTTRVASALPRNGNWLSPIDSSGRKGASQSVSPLNARASQHSAQAARAKQQPGRGAHAPQRKRVTSPLSSPLKPKQTAGSDSSKHPALADGQPDSSIRPPPHSFSPHDAGSRNHDLWLPVALRNGSRGPFTSRQGPKLAAPGTSVSGGGAHRGGDVSTTLRRARRVNIHFKGPAIGTSPHYLAYSVDLPASELAGADFLWKDNGVWMGDEANGVKILESPGLHRISVLLVTRDNDEYRGMATVQVLQRDPASSTATLGTH